MRAYGRHKAHNQTSPFFSWTLAYKMPPSHSLVLEMSRPEYPWFFILFFLALVVIMKAHWELRATRWQEPGSWTTTWSSFPNKICVWDCYMWCYYDTNSFGGCLCKQQLCHLLDDLTVTEFKEYLTPSILFPHLGRLWCSNRFSFFAARFYIHPFRATHYFPSWISPHKPCHSELSLHAWLWELPVTDPTESGSWSLDLILIVSKTIFRLTAKLSRRNKDFHMFSPFTHVWLFPLPTPFTRVAHVLHLNSYTDNHLKSTGTLGSVLVLCFFWAWTRVQWLLSTVALQSTVIANAHCWLDWIWNHFKDTPPCACKCILGAHPSP